MSGYVQAFTRPVAIDPIDTALVVVDMQYASGSRDRRLSGRVVSTDEAIGDRTGAPERRVA